MDDIEKMINAIESELVHFKEILKIEQKKQAVNDLQMKMAAPDFWQDPKESAKIVEQLKNFKNDVDEWSVLWGNLEDVKELIALSDESLESDIRKEAGTLEKACESLKLKVLFCEKFDEANAIVEINSGAGGTEACDWAGMLFRMYFRWAEDKKFVLHVLNEVRAEEAGIKNITFFIEGKRAYGLLRSEKGVHRLVRISPFDANKRRHTSFASVDVLPEIADGGDIQIKPEELKIDTFRASGCGGQHLNVTDSAVRITHLPTGIIVACQNERSQYQNKQVAMNVLKSKLFERREEDKKKELEKISGHKRKIEWGSQIRSYVLYPYLLVKDHRTDVENHNARAVLDGNLDDFIYAYLKLQKILSTNEKSA